MQAQASKPEKPLSVAVVGAGIVGVSAAIWLQRAGHDVTLIDREGAAAGASAGNGGVLAACAVVPVTAPGLIKNIPSMVLDRNSPLFLKYGYLPKMAGWAMKYLSHANARDCARTAKGLAQLLPDSLREHQGLAEGTAAARYIKPSSYYYLYADEAAASKDAFAWSLRADAGIKTKSLQGEAVKAALPDFNGAGDFAIAMDGHGSIADPKAYVETLAAHALGNKKLVKAKLQDLRENEDGTVTLALEGEGNKTFDRVLIATGAQSRLLQDLLGCSIPVETERGYHLDLYEPSFMPDAPVMVAGAKFVITPMEGRIRLAGTIEFAGLEAEASDKPIELLKRQVKAILPGLTWRGEVPWMGHRPAPTDSLPLLGRVPGKRNTFIATGHHHVGMTAGPKSGRLMAQLIAGEVPDVDLTAFDPARFSKNQEQHHHH
ncbi:FAD-binding oxidoreductase [Rhodobacteraceae bacterium RKSG542]|uniref:NAD(P)/FAD-dependent oxidoreductase n=1 Tax=Pseudovibrio flavus TaxID=2529854 RepID=UPI0012BBF8F4|nr:FAD-binding oxidoreductase [Pseudovibrio flavus]MTI15879.1 FAD-binding oxidoreductase [Pseudovibrio flavus]